MGKKNHQNTEVFRARLTSPNQLPVWIDSAHCGHGNGVFVGEQRVGKKVKLACAGGACGVPYLMWPEAAKARLKSRRDRSKKEEHPRRAEDVVEEESEL